MFQGCVVGLGNRVDMLVVVIQVLYLMLLWVLLYCVMNCKYFLDSESSCDTCPSPTKSALQEIIKSLRTVVDLENDAYHTTDVNQTVTQPIAQTIQQLDTGYNTVQYKDNIQQGPSSLSSQHNGKDTTVYQSFPQPSTMQNNTLQQNAMPRPLFPGDLPLPPVELQ